MKKLAVGLCLCLSVSSALAQEIAPEKAEQYGKAYGAVLGFVKSMNYMSASCGGSAKDLMAIWERRNLKQKAQAEALFSGYISQLAKQFGQKVAADSAVQVRQQLNQMQAEAAKKSFGQFESLPPNQKAFVCQKFVASVDSGEWTSRERIRLYTNIWRPRRRSQSDRAGGSEAAFSRDSARRLRSNFRGTFTYLCWNLTR